jgi:pimeloyl-ACP methyl ester carboxylesterase
MSDLGYVFLAGGAMSGWVWRDLDNELRSRAVIIAQRLEENTFQNRMRATLADCVDTIVRQIERSGHRRVHIVAHSGGGILAPLVAARMKDRVGRIAFVSANIPRHGTNGLHSLPLPFRALNALVARRQAKSDSTPARGRGKTIRSMFCNTASEEVIQYVLDQSLIAEPICMLMEKLDWTGVPRIPMTFIRLSKDRTATLEFQDRMAANLGITEKYDIESDHMVMLSHPRQFNDALHAVLS